MDADGCTPQLPARSHAPYLMAKISGATSRILRYEAAMTKHERQIPDNAAPILLREDNDGVATLTFNRPETRNTLSEAMLDVLGDSLATIAADRSIRAVVLAHRGPAFSAGHDLKELQ